MAQNPEPVVLELATLPREQAGPFLLLGLEKASEKRQIEKHWADRVRWARQQRIKIPLEDINWARDMLNDEERRLRSDTASLNTDTCDRLLGSLARRYGVEGGQARRMWQPLDREKSLADYIPPAEVPDVEQLRADLHCPSVPEELPAVSMLLVALSQEPLDPWGLQLPEEESAVDHHGG